MENEQIETVSIICKHPMVLLGMKKVRFGEGKWNGFGGKLKNGETLEECAIRETLEESGVKMLNPKKMGKLLFTFEKDEPNHLVYFFRADAYEGNPVESEEMEPRWFNELNIPYENMWLDDKYWLPLLLANKKFEGFFNFGLEVPIKNYEIKIVEGDVQ